MDSQQSTVEAAGSLLDPEQVGWFAVRQPSIMRLLTEQLGEGSDAFVVALDGAWRLASVFEVRDGVAPKRLSDAQLDNAVVAVNRDSLSGQAVADGAAARQTELCRWIAAFVADPPISLEKDEAKLVGNLLISILYALDAETRGEAAVAVPPLS